jgi:hypothetical protein
MDGVNYTHATVIHEANFVNPDIHTQNIEIMLMCVKRKLRRQFGTSRELFQTYLSEFRWRNVHRNDDKFKARLCCIADLYVVEPDIIISYCVLLIV